LFFSKLLSSPTLKPITKEKKKKTPSDVVLNLWNLPVPRNLSTFEKDPHRRAALSSPPFFIEVSYQVLKIIFGVYYFANFPNTHSKPYLISQRNLLIPVG